jgi:hypothetical protein
MSAGVHQQQGKKHVEAGLNGVVNWGSAVTRQDVTNAASRCRFGPTWLGIEFWFDIAIICCTNGEVYIKRV